MHACIIQIWALLHINVHICIHVYIYRYVWCHNHWIMWLICMSHLQHAQRKSKQSRLSVGIVCTCSWKLNESLNLLLHRPHPSLRGQQQLHVLEFGDVLAQLEWQIYHQTMPKNRPRLSLHSRISVSRPLEAHSVWCCLFKLPLYDHPYLCIRHYDCDQSWAF